MNTDGHLHNSMSYYTTITRNSSEDEIANVNFFTMTSFTYYKIQ